MNDAIEYIYGLGGEGDVVSTLQTILETNRYQNPNILCKLAHIVAGASKINNKDAPLFELCHLINAVDAAGFQGQNNLLKFFMAPTTITPSYFKQVFHQISGRNEWHRSGFKTTDTHVVIRYEDTEFRIHYARIPILSALFEFLLTMEGCGFFSELNDIIADMLSVRITIIKIKNASSRIASRFRKYRRAHIDWSKYEERFDKLSKFLSQHHVDNRWSISDSNILAFWLLHSTGTEFRGYKTVFDAFVVLLRVLQKGQLSLSIQGAKILGIDKEQSEVDPSETDRLDGYLSEWENPLPHFSGKQLKNINFLKRTSERQPIENLMKYGPYASKLPLGFLRLEGFSLVQSAITNDLQMKRGTNQIQKRSSCDEAIPYRQRLQTYREICHHLHVLKLAIWHVVSDSNSINDDKKNLQKDSRQAFESLRRKGFETKIIDDEKREAFVWAGELVVKIAGEIKRFRHRVETLNLAAPAQYEQDKEIFSKQLRKIYGVSP